MKRKTQIIATIGPKSIETQTLKLMIHEGMNIIRINSAYGNETQYQTILKNLNQVDPRKKIKTMFDLRNLDKLNFCLQQSFDYLALSFTEKTQQIEEIRKKIPSIPVIAKIESLPGVRNYKSILNIADGIMIARGDLSLVASLEKVPPLQKQFTQIAVKENKFVIAATEMLLSMTREPKPTNAEVSDVANAVFDGVNAVMLSEETAIGKYPVEAVGYMRRIIEQAEKWLRVK